MEAVVSIFSLFGILSSFGGNFGDCFFGFLAVDEGGDISPYTGESSESYSLSEKIECFRGAGVAAVAGIFFGFWVDVVAAAVFGVGICGIFAAVVVEDDEVDGTSLMLMETFFEIFFSTPAYRSRNE